MEAPKITKSIEVQDIGLSKGQYLTVWLAGHQVELRVTHGGEPEIYVDGVVTKSFTEHPTEV